MTIPCASPKVSPHCPHKPQKSLLHRLNSFKQTFLLLLLLLFFFILLPFIKEGIPFFPEYNNPFSYLYGLQGTDDNAQDLLQAEDGGFVLAGITWSYGVGQSDMWLLKTDRYGIPLWNCTFGGTSKDWASAIIQTGEGDYMLAGGTFSFGTGNSDMWLVKTDEVGNLLWNQTYGGTKGEWAEAIVQTSDNGFVIAGYTSSYGAGADDMWLVKIDASGLPQWNATYGGIDDDRARSLIQTTDGGFILAGHSWSHSEGNDDMWVGKIDESGNLMWSHTYGGPEREWVEAIIQTTDYGFAFTGQSWSSGVGDRDIWLVKTDESGLLQWKNVYGGGEKAGAENLVQTTDGGFAFAGFTSTTGIGSFVDLWLVKTDNDGDLQWDRSYGGDYHDMAYSLVQTSDGGFALAGISEAPWFYPYFGGGDMWLIKTDSEGEILTVDNNSIPEIQSFLILMPVALINCGYLQNRRKKFL